MAKKKSDTAKYAVTRDGERFLIQKDDGRYYLCGGESELRFRKANVTVEEEKAEKTEKQPEEAPGE